ncbi:TetR/AcrR family transcriptional regulator [Listeria cossartiae subsp. cayugensis]|uniref:TetR/AcrR family transcriptional regulator n=1 Tax=Listeria cossartiae subsp. cayugensis TaxID=2713505 RepID=A0ABU2IRA0_9LIST|nr:TetR/AcrR family transcriptional regulator [Listeria cossartiae]MDT0050717.1 TetR/AcrR family transcriptional regulator [Listeria cossartiae subsp. cayugensis]MDT0067196.1 TetR/AcrR family transcriptional regulator [Listeria cossartiae subsp. cayugensis]MDT0081108.1 TetR/AcrR family transcriptional regulator [Listeria cossartiae subsp. cayugensis]MDT0083921.1 TetR/AcrR family transcriptional regulator [Listeria cossartiae subsp. cayugensis]MDT0089429.1 TetR/AcrR family transcriptional regul
MNNYEKRTQKKKLAIIQAALTLFGKQGFSDVSIKDIASLAAVSQVSIYNYFGSKEALVGECAKIIMQDTIALAEEILASEGTFTQKLKRAIQLCNAEINLSLSKFISKEASKDQQFLMLLVNNINSLKKDIYMKYVAAGKEAQVIDNAISDEVIQLFIDAINGLGLTVPEEELAEKQAEIIQLFLYGLIGKAQK